MARRGKDRMAGQPAEAGPRPLSGPGTVAGVLRARREELGLGLEQAAQSLFIRRPHLDAIESGRFQDLPGGAYALGFVRSYADYLGLDSRALVERFKRETAGIEPRPELNYVFPVAESRTPSAALLLLALVLAGGVFAGWRLWQGERPAPPPVAEVPPRLAAAAGDLAVAAAPNAIPSDAGAPATPDAGTPNAGAADPGEEATPDLPQLTPSATDLPLLVPASNPLPASLSPVPVPPATTAGAAVDGAPAAASGPAGGRIVLRAEADTWVTITDQRGREIFDELLQPGETYVVPDTPNLLMLVGNAGGLAVEVDGQRTLSLGSSGQVRRGVLLDPDRLLAQARAAAEQAAAAQAAPGSAPE